MSYTYGYASYFEDERKNIQSDIDFLISQVGKPYYFEDVKKGREPHSPSYEKLMRFIKKGDRLMLIDLASLGRNLEEICTRWRMLTNEKGIRVVVINMPFLSSGDEVGRKVSTAMAQKILDNVCAKEHSYRSHRQSAAMLEAKDNGSNVGRPRLYNLSEVESVCEDYANGLLSSAEARTKLKVSQNTFMRYMRDYRNRNSHAVQEETLLNES